MWSFKPHLSVEQTEIGTLGPSLSQHTKMYYIILANSNQIVVYQGTLKDNE